jgi:hypothetical protein
MNDIKSLLIATTVLAIGGLGLYMYKSEDSDLIFDEQIDDDNSETGSESGSETESDLDSELEELDYDDYKPKEKKNGGTKKNTKKNGGTRKKH